MMGWILLGLAVVGGGVLYFKYREGMDRIDRALPGAVNRFNTDPAARAQLQAMFKPKANYSSSSMYSVPDG